jgi:outer membrane protein assembly factor BamB
MQYVLRSLVIIFLAVLCSCTSYKPPAPAPLVGFPTTLNVQPVWSNHIASGTYGNYLKLTPAFINNTIFVNGYQGEISAINASNGAKIWKINTGLHLTSGLAAGNNMLFVGGDEGQFLVYNQANGALKWWTPMSSQILATPGVADNIALVKAENGQLSAFDVSSSKNLWTYNHEEPTLILRGGSTPRVFGNKVVVGFADGQLVVIDLHDGQFIWREAVAEGQGSMAVQRMVDIDVNPQIINGVIYVATYQGRIAAINLQNGKVLWQHKLSSYSGLAVDRERVYVSDDVGHVWAFARTTGQVLWKQSALTNRHVTGPALVGNALVVGDGFGYLHFMSKDDGNFVARVLVRKQDAIIAEPITYSNNVFVYTTGGYLARYVVS